MGKRGGFPNMLRKASEAVPEGNGSVPQQEESGSGQPTLEEISRMILDRWDKMLDRSFKKIEECIEEPRSIEQRLTRLEHGARQRRLAMEADGHANTKTRERTEGAATAVQTMRGDSYTTAQKVRDGPKTSITFGVEAEPSDLPYRDYVLVESDDAAPTPCLPSLEIRSPTAAGGLPLTGEASTATRTTSNEPLPCVYATEEMNPEEDSKKKHLWTSTPGIFLQSNLSAASYCGGSLRQNPDKIGRLIEAVRKVISAPARL